MKKTTLKHETEIFAGFPLRGAAESLSQGDVHLIQMRNIASDLSINWNSVPCVSLPSKRPPNWLKNGDVIFAARGSSNYAVSVDALPSKAVCSPHFFVLRTREPKELLPEFLAWQINQKPAQDYFQRTATGSYILNIRRRAVENLEIAIPSLYKQGVIVKMHQTAISEKQVFRALITNRNKQMEAVAADLFRNGGDQSNG